jgi:hypothetical protein
MLTRDMKFICNATQLGLPYLPVNGEEEFKLFAKLIRLNKGHFDEIVMTFEWVPYCNGKTILPKPPLHLGWHHKKWLRNEETRAAMKKAAYKCGDSFIKTFHLESMSGWSIHTFSCVAATCNTSRDDDGCTGSKHYSCAATGTGNYWGYINNSHCYTATAATGQENLQTAWNKLRAKAGKREHVTGAFGAVFQGRSRRLVQDGTTERNVYLF